MVVWFVCMCWGCLFVRFVAYFTLFSFVLLFGFAISCLIVSFVV